MPYGWHDGGWGFLWMILVWAIFLAIVVVFVRAAFPSGGRDERSRGAREILAERFARGEISEDEYRERKRVLDESRR